MMIEDLASCEAFLSKTVLDQHQLGNLQGRKLARLLSHEHFESSETHYHVFAFLSPFRSFPHGSLALSACFSSPSLFSFLSSPLSLSLSPCLSLFLLPCIFPKGTSWVCQFYRWLPDFGSSTETNLSCFFPLLVLFFSTSRIKKK